MKRYKKISSDLRKKILELSYVSKSSHLGSSLSIVDILLVLYDNFIYKKNIFILSKGHACLALYCVLNKFGYINTKTLDSFGKNNSKLMWHASHKVPGVIFSSGSLGHGIPFATGVALAEKVNKTNNKIYVLISEGELNEGTTWESLLFASFHKLDNLIIIIDYNKIQSIDYSKNILKLEPLSKKFISFGCDVKKIDGHNFLNIYNSLKILINKPNKKPKIVIANTIKGKGIKFMENKIIWHYSSPNFEQLTRAIKIIK